MKSNAINEPSTQLGVQAYRVLRRKQIEQTFGMSRSTIYARLDPKSKQYDPAFPRPIQLGVSSCSIGWIESEVNAYIAHLIAASRA